MGSSENTTEYSVSVVIPAYNAEKFIGRTIESVLAQTRPADEIIVVDDGSGDKTAEAVKTFGDKVRYIRQQNAGASAARNTGIQAAEYEWIAFLDADDEWQKNKLELQMSLLQRNRHLMWTGGNYINFLASSNRKAPRNDINKTREIMRGKDLWDDYFKAFATGVWGCTDTMIINRKAFEEAGMFLTGQPRANDLDMWFRIANIYPEFGFVCEPLAVYYLEIDESISRKQAHLQWHEEFISRHLEIAEEHGRLKAFEPCATFMLRLWMRSMLFGARGKEIRNLLSRFGYLLPWGFRVSMRILTIYPKVTQAGCMAISRIVRALNLRRQVVRKPNR
ncbi:MAG: glycosyltransferase family 2 protein [Phycisphaerae bacterium]|nr:glycosyltransferase family 2 protein [Phycisphaerae bacterium]